MGGRQDGRCGGGAEMAGCRVPFLLHYVKANWAMGGMDAEP